MTDSEGKLSFMAKVDRRSGKDRRQFFYTAYIPERRNGTDRRKGKNGKSSFDLQCVLNTKRSKV
jgi:hypothetical protein